MDEPFAPTEVAASCRVDPSTAGSFRFWFATGRWEWSPEVFRMHGYIPGEIEPTTELVLSHKHPEDRQQVADLINRAVQNGEPFSSRHRFLDTTGAIHSVMVAADRIVDASGTVAGTSGFYIDLTDTLVRNEKATVATVLPEMLEARAVIEKAKGVLMLMYRISDAQAFRLLVWRSQETNVKLRALASRLIADLSLLPPPEPGMMNVFDHVLLTTHERLHGEHR
ncbi:PAS and ANTAR domain-containing protein [Nocardia vaccinii]|uniref:PAS and ANTAR domain-containing protein n=1 Tax=Nocardia vaccinii TaxID=1822 RepID=UPI000833C0CA|nr:PAS and ANTAR domain-containing protein [Nocardia vaccinii]